MSEKSRFDEEASNKVYEENQAEIEAETSKPFEKEKRLGEVEQYQQMKMGEISAQRKKVGDLFGINAEEEMAKYRNFLEESKNGKNTGYINRFGDQPWMPAIKALTKKVDKYNEGADIGKDVLNRRERNEMKKKTAELLAEIEGL